MKKYILTDIDQTCLDWYTGFKLYMLQKHDRTLIGLPDQYSMQNWLDLNEDEITKLSRDFNENYEDFGNLEPCLKSEIYLPKFYNDGYTLIAITASSSLPVSIERRKENLLNVFGDIFSEIHCVDTPEEKRQHLAKHPPSVFVEDKILNAEMGLDYDHKSVLVRWPSSITHEHDEKYRNLIWVNDWQQIWNIRNTL